MNFMDKSFEKFLKDKVECEIRIERTTTTGSPEASSNAFDMSSKKCHRMEIFRKLFCKNSKTNTLGHGHSLKF